MRLLEAQHAPETRDGNGGDALDRHDHPPDAVDAVRGRRRLVVGEGLDHAGVGARRDEVDEDVEEEGEEQVRPTRQAHKDADDYVLDGEQHARHDQRVAEDAKVGVVAAVSARGEGGADQGEPHKGNHHDYLAHAGVDAVVLEADIVEHRVEPRQPDDGEEADVGEERGVVDDVVVRREGGQVGDEEEVEEQLRRARFMPRREDEVLLVDALERILNPWHDGMDPPLRSSLVAARRKVRRSRPGWLGDRGRPVTYMVLRRKGAMATRLFEASRLNGSFKAHTRHDRHAKDMKGMENRLG